MDVFTNNLLDLHKHLTGKKVVICTEERSTFHLPLQISTPDSPVIGFRLLTAAASFQNQILRVHSASETNTGRFLVRWRAGEQKT